MRARLLGLALAAVVAVGATLPLAAQFPEIPPGKWWKRPAVVSQLQLTTEQQGRLEEIFGKNRRTFIDLKADLERRQVDVEELVATKDSDPKKVSVAIDALEQARARLRKSHTMMLVEMKGILSSEQWQIILDRTEDWRRLRQEGRMEGRQEGPGGRPRMGGRNGRPRNGPE